MNLGPLLSGFAWANPWLLLGLIGLPVIWLIARATPPAPKQLVFPPAALLENLPRTDQATTTAPWWLKVMRMIAIGLLLVGLAGPRIEPKVAAGPGDLVIVLDNGWSAASSWQDTIRDAARAASAARGTVKLVFTAPDRTAPNPDATLSSGQAVAILQAATPVPLAVDHQAAARVLAALGKNQQVLWFSDGLNWPGTEALTAAMARAGQAQVRIPEVMTTAIASVVLERTGLRVLLAATPASLANPTIEARDARGRVLATAEANSGSRATIIPLSEGQASNVAEVRVRAVAGAGAVRLLDAWDRRTRIGIVAPRADDQPLLSDAHYLAAAVQPWADTSRGEAAGLARAGFNAIMVPDTGLLDSAEERALSRFVDQGGVLIRFAGPRFAETGGTQLSPVPVAKTPRILTGSLAWQQAGGLAPFAAGSPFAGLTVPADARIRTIAVAERGAVGAVGGLWFGPHWLMAPLWSVPADKGRDGWFCFIPRQGQGGLMWRSQVFRSACCGVLSLKPLRQPYQPGKLPQPSP